MAAGHISFKKTAMVWLNGVVVMMFCLHEQAGWVIGSIPRGVIHFVFIHMSSSALNIPVNHPISCISLSTIFM